MEHVVFFSETPGEPEFRRVGDLEEAVRLVEKLRNDRGISDVSLHALTPVPVSFRTYYRVEVAVADATDAASDGAASDSAASDGAAAAASEDAPEFEADDVPLVALASLPDLEPALEPVDSLASLAALPDPEPDPEPDPAPEPAFDSVLTLLPPPADDYLGAGADDHTGSGVSFLHPLDEVASSDDEPIADDEADGTDLPVGFELPQARPDSEPERSLGYFAH